MLPFQTMKPDRRQTIIALSVLILGIVLLAVADWQLAPAPRWESSIGPHR